MSGWFEVRFGAGPTCGCDMGPQSVVAHQFGGGHAQEARGGAQPVVGAAGARAGAGEGPLRAKCRHQTMGRRGPRAESGRPGPERGRR